MKLYCNITVRKTEVKGHAGQGWSEREDTQNTRNFREQKTKIINIWIFSNSGLSPV